jgi:tetratricopeptide (TPR) repeat protein
MISVSSIFRNRAALALLLAASWCPVGAADALLEDAIRLYDAGQYSESKPLLEQLVAAGNADGITYYRLYFCQRTSGDTAQQQTLEQARALLEKEVAVAQGFEAAFYLSNTYSNLGLSAEVPRFAAAVTARFEAEDIQAPTTAVEQFRLGKLYADQERARQAEPWFEKALDGFEAADNASFQPYLEWGARWLGERAMAEERFEEAAKQFGRLAESANATLEDLDSLGMASLMVGEYRTATKAWQRAVLINPGNADRYRYGTGLAELCRVTKEIPISPDGERGWDELSGEELDQILTQNAAVVREVKIEAEAIDEVTGEQRKAFNARIQAVRPVFIGAALESMRRRINLREAAFFGGYAPLIFHAQEWRITPAPPQKRLRVRDPRPVPQGQGEANED